MRLAPSSPRCSVHTSSQCTTKLQLGCKGCRQVGVGEVLRRHRRGPVIRSDRCRPHRVASADAHSSEMPSAAENCGSTHRFFRHAARRVAWQSVCLGRSVGARAHVCRVERTVRRHRQSVCPDVSDTCLSRTRDSGTSWQAHAVGQFAAGDEIVYQADAMRELGFLGGERLLRVPPPPALR